MYQNHTLIILHNQIPQDSPEDVLDILKQAKWIEEILNKEGYSTLLLSFSLENLNVIQEMNASKPLLVFNLVDSAPHEETLSYLTPGILEYMKILYTGCSFENLHTTTNKVLTKQILSKHGINTPSWIFKEKNEASTNPLIEKYIIKPVSEDASVGLDESSIVPSKLVLESLKEKEISIGKPCFAEAYIDGREFTVCMYGSRSENTILSPFEWVFKDFEQYHKEKIITYDAKWADTSFGYNHIEASYVAQNCDIPLRETLTSIAQQCWSILNLSGYARVDFRVDELGIPWVLEINCNPSFYSFYHLAIEGGFSFEKFITKIVEQVQPL